MTSIEIKATVDPLIFRKGNTKPQQLRLALTDDGLVLQGLWRWWDETTSTDPKVWAELQKGEEWRDMPMVDLRTNPVRALVTLVEANQKRRSEYEKMDESHKPHPNGIECPSCRQELWDSDPMVLLTSNPPQKNVHCPACGYVGFRID